MFGFCVIFFPFQRCHSILLLMAKQIVSERRFKWTLDYTKKDTAAIRTPSCIDMHAYISIMDSFFQVQNKCATTRWIKYKYNSLTQRKTNICDAWIRTHETTLFSTHYTPKMHLNNHVNELTFSGERMRMIFRPCHMSMSSTTQYLVPFWNNTDTG